uniref:Ovule protein n=1 Tax=Caenorhabditis tropicalis TaxID=1561998 RepID=A0A1I7U416_9PELO
MVTPPLTTSYFNSVSFPSSTQFLLPIRLARSTVPQKPRNFYYPFPIQLSIKLGLLTPSPKSIIFNYYN